MKHRKRKRERRFYSHISRFECVFIYLSLFFRSFDSSFVRFVLLECVDVLRSLFVARLQSQKCHHDCTHTAGSRWPPVQTEWFATMMRNQNMSIFTTQRNLMFARPKWVCFDSIAMAFVFQPHNLCSSRVISNAIIIEKSNKRVINRECLLSATSTKSVLWAMKYLFNIFFGLSRYTHKTSFIVEQRNVRTTVKMEWNWCFSDIWRGNRAVRWFTIHFNWKYTAINSIKIELC